MRLIRSPTQPRTSRIGSTRSELITSKNEDRDGGSEWAPIVVPGKRMWQGWTVPANTDELVDMLRLRRVSDQFFVGHHPDTVRQRTFGGQVLAQALAAAYGTVPDDRLAHSLHGYFLRPGRVGADITFHVESTRDGKSFSTRRVSGSQRGREIFTLSASFHRSEPGLEHHDPMPTDVPAPEDCPVLGDVMAQRFGPNPHWDECDALEVRFIGDSSPGGTIPEGRHVAAMRVWLRASGRLPEGQALHHEVLTYMSDLTLLHVSTVPHPVAFRSSELQIASIDHVMWFHRPFRADEWMLYDMFSPSASQALGYSSGRLFQNGELIASCAQEGLIRPIDD